eukprot:scaffold241485_cov18-Tisochrysis_lutea.AAC.1
MVLANSAGNLQFQFSNFNEYAHYKELIVNTDKTKVTAFSVQIPRKCPHMSTTTQLLKLSRNLNILGFN